MEMDYWDVIGLWDKIDNRVLYFGRYDTASRNRSATRRLLLLSPTTPFYRRLDFLLQGSEHWNIRLDNGHSATRPMD
uniref:Uncharacterized protein n=1 Tax=Solanum tuberosum TaxID=4113 RepID=M1DIN2_SOLTU